MKYLRLLLLVAVGCAVGWFPGSSDAGPFGIFGNKKCTDGNCPIHSPNGTTGRGDYNAKGGYTGEVPQAYFDSYLAIKEPATETETDSIPSAPTANGGHVTESARAPDVPAEAVQPGPTVALAVDTPEARLAALEVSQKFAMAEAKAEVERASADRKRQAKLDALQLRQRMDKMRTDFDSQMADFQSQLEGLTPLEPTPAE